MADNEPDVQQLRKPDKPHATFVADDTPRYLTVPPHRPALVLETPARRAV